MIRIFTIVLLLFSLNLLQGQATVIYTHFDTAAPKVGDYVSIRGVVWEFGHEPLSPDYYDSTVRFINTYRNVVFQIESHTDCRASAEYNRDLSQRRADTARAELLRLINDTTQLPIAVGKGEDEPALPKCQCDLSDIKNICTEAEHQQNRRTLLRVIEIRDTSDPKGIMKK